MNVQLLVDPYKELQSQTFHGINLETVYWTVYWSVNTFFIYTKQMSDLWGLYSSSGTSKRCNSFCPWWSRHLIVSKRAPLARLQCVQFGLCVISERLLYWRSSSVSYCLWRAESMVLCWQDWWGNSYKDCGGNNMTLSLVIFLTYCLAWNVCWSLRFLWEQILQLGEIGFSCWELILWFQKVPDQSLLIFSFLLSMRNGNIYSEKSYKQCYSLCTLHCM